MNVIDLKNISFSYVPRRQADGNDEVLKDISLSVPKHDYLGMVGPNGAGKTTLLKIMLGILKPSTGSVELLGSNLSNFKDWKKVGYVPQKATNFDSQFPATVAEVVLMGRYGRRGLLHHVTSEDKARAMTSLCQVDMEDYANRLIGDLSGGQQQRVFIARALATEPEIMFLDEPTTSIDSVAQDEFYSLLKKLNEETGLTLILISHDVQRITKEAKHIICIDKTMVCDATPQEFLKQHTAMQSHSELHHHA